MTRNIAESYGPNVSSVNPVLQNPLVIDSDEDIKRIGGMILPRVVRDSDEDLRGRALAAFRQKAEEAGHDGVVVLLGPTDSGVISGNDNRQLRSTFAHSQVIEFNPQRAEEDAQADADADAESDAQAAMDEELADIFGGEPESGNVEPDVDADAQAAMDEELADIFGDPPEIIEEEPPKPRRGAARKRRPKQETQETQEDVQTPRQRKRKKRQAKIREISGERADILRQIQARWIKPRTLALLR